MIESLLAIREIKRVREISFDERGEEEEERTGVDRTTAPV